MKAANGKSDTTIHTDPVGIVGSRSCSSQASGVLVGEADPAATEQVGDLFGGRFVGDVRVTRIRLDGSRSWVR